MGRKKQQSEKVEKEHIMNRIGRRKKEGNKERNGDFDSPNQRSKRKNPNPRDEIRRGEKTKCMRDLPGSLIIDHHRRSMRSGKTSGARLIGSARARAQAPPQDCSTVACPRWVNVHTGEKLHGGGAKSHRSPRADAAVTSNRMAVVAVMRGRPIVSFS